MQPPLSLIGDPAVDWIIVIGGFIVCLYWLRALRLAREGVRRFLRSLAISFVVFVCCQLALVGLEMQEGNRNFISGLIAAGVLYRRAGARRSRNIPTAVKHAVIARDLKGEQYDSKKHHLDHVWPFALGGSHTTDNLRVLEKRKNLQKGAKRPRLRDMW